MGSDDVSRVTVRDAVAADIPALTAIKGEGSQALHLDRLGYAREPGFRYLVLVTGEEIIGFACLVTRRPAQWSDAGDTQHLPQIVDLQVTESRRGQGYGAGFVHAIERIAAAAGYREIYLSVEPTDNPRAFKFYRRLGYQPLQFEPYLKSWEFIDSEGKVHHGDDWVVDMVKSL